VSRPKLKPVRANLPPRLGDSDAKWPGEAPGEQKLEKLLRKAADRVCDQQKTLFADGRYALLVVLQGRDASGKDSAIKNVFREVDPQGLEVTSFGVPSKLEAKHDFLWRVHQRIPARGMIGVFNRSHYEDVLVPRVNGSLTRKQWTARYRQINDFERMLTENGVVIRKFFLHMSRGEQRKQLQERLEDPEKNWKFRKEDLDDRKLWPRFTAAYRDLLRACSTTWAPWFLVPADDKPLRNYLIARQVAETLESLDLRYPKAVAEIRGIRID
jgi:PPK2 family polyphosphate:nucleotide phosphotransferase